jgi:hypothetical protein
MKKILIGLGAMLLVAGMTGFASAAIVNFDFTGGPGASSPSLTFTGDDGLTQVTATAVGGVFHGTDGLGVGAGELAYPAVLDLSFLGEVNMVQATFAAVTGEDDFSLTTSSDYIHADIPSGNVYNFPRAFIDNIFAYAGYNSNDDYYLSGITVDTQNPVPEPATMLLFGTGLAGLAGVSRKRRKNSVN